MALIIEDGTIVDNANSFTTDIELQAYANARGLTLPATEAERDALQINAMDFIASNEDCMQGKRVDVDQELSFPRIDVWVHDFAVQSDQIPNTLKKAQMEAAITSQTVNLLPSGTVKNVQSESLDTMSISYFKGGNSTSVQAANIYNYLQPVLVNNTKLVRT